MTDDDRNIRTLVVCFVLALAALVPMRLIQGGVVAGDSTYVQVLGESEEVQGDKMEIIYSDETSDDEEPNLVVEEQVVLPDAEVTEAE